MSKSTVSVATCESYEKNLVVKDVADAVNALGGIGNFVHPGEKVLIKPNFLYPAEAEKAITTSAGDKRCHRNGGKQRHLRISLPCGRSGHFLC